MMPSNLNEPLSLLRGIKGQQHREAVTAGLGLTSCCRSPVYDITGRAPECRQQLGPAGAARSRALGSTWAGSPRGRSCGASCCGAGAGGSGRGWGAGAPWLPHRREAAGGDPRGLPRKPRVSTGDVGAARAALGHRDLGAPLGGLRLRYGRGCGGDPGDPHGH